MAEDDLTGQGNDQHLGGVGVGVGVGVCPVLLQAANVTTAVAKTAIVAALIAPFLKFWSLNFAFNFSKNFIRDSLLLLLNSSTLLSEFQ